MSWDIGLWLGIGLGILCFGASAGFLVAAILASGRGG